MTADRKEKLIDEETKSDAPSAPSGGSCDPTLVILVGVQVLTVCVALVAVAANVYVMVEQSNLTPKDYALRAYAIFFCGTIVLAESEWARFIEQLKVLEQFSAKGIWYGFVGLLTLDMVSRRACARCPT